MRNPASCDCPNPSPYGLEGPYCSQDLLRVHALAFQRYAAILILTPLHPIHQNGSLTFPAPVQGRCCKTCLMRCAGAQCSQQHNPAELR